MSTHNICFRGEIRKYQYFWIEKASYQELCCGYSLEAPHNMFFYGDLDPVVQSVISLELVKGHFVNCLADSVYNILIFC